MSPKPPSLLTFLRQCRSHIRQLPSQTKPNPVLVIGNPSADLDSFVCAVIYAYFHSLPPNTRPHIPILNVPFPSHDIPRQRPEFATALAVRKEGYYVQGWEDHRKEQADQDFKPDNDGGILAEVLTRHDLQESSSFSKHKTEIGPLDAILVDWNSLAGDSGESRLTESYVSVQGCIDHHIDENYVPSQPHLTDPSSPRAPRIIETAGSCTSLVLHHLLDSNLWPSSPASRSADTTPCEEEAQTVQLALSAILIDTANLQNKGRVTEADVSAVDLLTRTMSPTWDRTKFYEEVKNAKTRGLELLTIEEILAKDYKEWNISENETLGIASVVLPLKTLISRSSGASQFLSTLQSFAKSHNLSTIAVMTTSTSADGDFQRELLLHGLDSTSATKLSSFVDSEWGSSSELSLELWKDVSNLAWDEKGADPRSVHVFWQRDVSKSRKQVAPLLRKALGEKMES
jgi:exopolyphosphatase